METFDSPNVDSARDTTKEKEDFVNNDKRRRHELRKQLKQYRLSNIALKKRIRMCSKVRYLNRIRLERDMTQLNSLISAIRNSLFKKLVNPEKYETHRYSESSGGQTRFKRPRIIQENSNLERGNSSVENEDSNSNDSATECENSSVPTMPVEKNIAEFKFFCDRCDFKCKKRSPFDIHLRRHTGERPFSCKFCDKTFVAKYELKLHAAKHENGGNFSCDQCTFVTYRADMLFNHRQKHFGVKPQKKDGLENDQRLKNYSNRNSQLANSQTPCVACEKLKTSTSALSLVNKPSNSKFKTSNNDLTGLSVTSVSENLSITSAMAENSSKIVANATKTSDSEGKSSNTHQNPSQSCNMVKHDSLDDMSLTERRNAAEIHVDVSGEQGKSVKWELGMLRYKGLKHTCLLWICEACGLAFKKKESLTKHMRTHSGERPFQCDRCDYSAATKHTLSVHIRKHTGEKPYSCDKCSFRCSTKGYLKIHLNNHLGIKPFSCHLCPYRAVDSSKMLAHKRNRHGECSGTSRNSDDHPQTVEQSNEWFACEICSKRFASEPSCKRHVSRHHPTAMACKDCDYTTNVGRDFKRHVKTHDKGHICGICNYRTSQSSVFVKHMERHRIEGPGAANEGQVSSAADNNQYSAVPVILNIPANPRLGNYGPSQIAGDERHGQDIQTFQNVQFQNCKNSDFWNT